MQDANASSVRVCSLAGPLVEQMIRQDMHTCILYVYIYIHMCQGLNSHYFHIIGDGHQPNSRGFYTHYRDSD